MAVLARRETKSVERRRGSKHGVQNISAPADDRVPFGASPRAQCRAVAEAEVFRVSKATALSNAMGILRKPLPSMEHLQGLPPDLVRRCQVTTRVEEALSMVPEALRQEWKENTLDDWISVVLHDSSVCGGVVRDDAVKGDKTRNTRRAADRLTCLTPEIRQHSSSPCLLPRGALELAPERPGVELAGMGAPGEGKDVKSPTEAAYALLERWVRGMRSVAPCGTLARYIAEIVHGENPVLPPDPIGQEMKRIVPTMNVLEPAPSRRGCTFLEEFIEALKLEEGFDVCSVMHKDFPEHFERDQMLQRCKRPASAVPSSSSGNKSHTFAKAFSGPNRVTARVFESWTAGQAPRSPRVDVPGPGFYCDRSLQRAVSCPKAGEFMSCGMPRTKCSSVMNSCSGRFGSQDLYVAKRQRPGLRAAAKKRPSSAPSGMRTLKRHTVAIPRRSVRVDDMSSLSGIAAVGSDQSGSAKSTGRKVRGSAPALL